jgi:hypothetical protein
MWLEPYKEALAMMEWFTTTLLMGMAALIGLCIVGGILVLWFAGPGIILVMLAFVAVIIVLGVSVRGVVWLLDRASDRRCPITADVARGLMQEVIEDRQLRDEIAAKRPVFDPESVPPRMPGRRPLSSGAPAQRNAENWHCDHGGGDPEDRTAFVKAKGIKYRCVCGVAYDPLHETKTVDRQIYSTVCGHAVGVTGNQGPAGPNPCRGCIPTGDDCENCK